MTGQELRELCRKIRYHIFIKMLFLKTGGGWEAPALRQIVTISKKQGASRRKRAKVIFPLCYFLKQDFPNYLGITTASMT